MLSCRDVELLFQDFCDGYLLPSQREILETHLLTCGACSSLLAGFSRIDDRLGDLGDMNDEVETPPHLTRDILAAPPAVYAPSRISQVMRYAGAPIVLLVLVVSGFLLNSRYFLKNTQGPRDVEVLFVAPAASTVAVVGDFNGWDPRRNMMVRSTHEGLWRTRVKLQPGVYQYSFVVDGDTWVSDPQAKKVISDGFGGENSVIIVDG